MKAELLNRNYVQSETILVQGDTKKVKEAKKEGYVIRSGGKGTYVMGKDSQALATYKVGEEIHTNSIRKVVLDYCGGSNVTEKKFNKFCDAWETGKVEVKFSEETKQLYI